jgi:hypothetical protein
VFWILWADLGGARKVMRRRSNHGSGTTIVHYCGFFSVARVRSRLGSVRMLAALHHQGNQWTETLRTR